LGFAATVVAVVVSVAVSIDFRLSNAYETESSSHDFSHEMFIPKTIVRFAIHTSFMNLL
jgi:hypothetical protein